jgi:hypothetical protein
MRSWMAIRSAVGALGVFALVGLGRAQPPTAPPGADCYDAEAGALPHCFATHDACIRSRDALHDWPEQPRCRHWPAAPVCFVFSEPGSARPTGMNCSAGMTECEEDRAYLSQPEVRERRHIETIGPCVQVTLEP